LVNLKIAMGYVFIKPVHPPALGGKGGRGEFLHGLKANLPGSELIKGSLLLRVGFSGRNELSGLISRLNSRIGAQGVPSASPRYLPARMVCQEDAALPPEWLWRIAPVGGLVVPGAAKMTGAVPWLYNWELIALGRGMRLDRMLFPLRSLLLQGDGVRECFFCGSFAHDESGCSLATYSPYGQDGSKSVVSRLCRVAPEHWLAILKGTFQAGKGGDGKKPRASRGDAGEVAAATGRQGASSALLDNLAALMADMRYPFHPGYAAVVCRSGAVSFAEMDKIPERRLRPGPLKDAMEMAARGDLAGCARLLGHMDEEGQGSEFFILKGLCLLFQKRPDRAMVAWLEAERCAKTPLRKSYAILLQSRLFFLKGDRPGAMDAASRAIRADTTCAFAPYWRMAMSGHRGQCSEAASFLAGKENSAYLLMSALCDPILIPCEEVVERLFRQGWLHTEERLRRRVEALEKSIDAVSHAFGPDATADVAKAFMKWRGRWAQMGLCQLKEAEGFLEELSERLRQAAANGALSGLKELFRVSEQARRLLETLPAGQEGRRLRSGLVDFIKEASGVINRKPPPALSELIALREQVERLLSDFQAIDEACRQLFHKAMRARLIKRYAVLGVMAMMIIWLAIYLYVMW
jgi:hypothetical protein